MPIRDDTTGPQQAQTLGQVQNSFQTLESRRQSHKDVTNYINKNIQ